MRDTRRHFLEIPNPDVLSLPSADDGGDNEEEEEEEPLWTAPAQCLGPTSWRY
jgi:hypothetical protein